MTDDDTETAKTAKTTKTTKTARSTKDSKDAKDATGGATGASRRPRGSSFDVAKARTLLARLLWALCSLFALILALAALLIALDANADNELVRWLIARADNVDLGFFDLGNPIKDFDRKKGEIDDVKTALFNYGIAAIIWLVLGKFLDKIVRS